MNAAASFSPLALARALVREELVRYLERLLEQGTPRERALRLAATAFHFGSSVSSLRRWEANYRRMGLRGLFEDRLGRCGRKPKRANGRASR